MTCAHNGPTGSVAFNPERSQPGSTYDQIAPKSGEMWWPQPRRGQAKTVEERAGVWALAAGTGAHTAAPDKAQMNPQPAARLPPRQLPVYTASTQFPGHNSLKKT